MKIALLFLLTLFSYLQAHSCQTLCQKFGDYEACRKVKNGITDCSVPVPVSLENSVQDSQKLRYIFYTPWKPYDEGVRFRFKVLVDPEQFLFTAETSPPGLGDGYFFEYTHQGVSSAHMIDDVLSCRWKRNGTLRCEGSEGVYRNARIKYSIGKNGEFDMKFSAIIPTQGRWERSMLHLYKRGNTVYEDYYVNGRKKPDGSQYHIVHSRKVELGGTDKHSMQTGSSKNFF